MLKKLFILLFLMGFLVYKAVHFFRPKESASEESEAPSDGGLPKKQKKENHDQPIDLALNRDGLTEQECFALDVGEIAYFPNYAMITEAELLSTMQSRWGVSFDDEGAAKDRILFALRACWSSGLVDLLLHNHDFLELVTIKDAVAFDSASFVVVIHQARALNLISSEEAWGMLYLNAQRVQDSYDSWTDFTHCYLKGYLCDRMIRSNEEASNFQRLETALKKEPQWQTRLFDSVNMKWINKDIFDSFTVNRTDKMDSSRQIKG